MASIPDDAMRRTPPDEAPLPHTITRVVYRHTLPLRIMHWINAICLLILLGSGLQIFNAHPALYWGQRSTFEHPWLSLGAIQTHDGKLRGVTQLGLKGAIINSHTHGEYLDQPKFWEIFAAAESLGVPLYLHPNTPSRQMIQPFLEAGLDGAIFGFAAETGLHLLRIITAGVFDRFPRLQIVVGHLGEALPFWLFRIDFMHRRAVAANRYAALRKLNRAPSDYLRENVYVTTSGMAWAPAIEFVLSVLGADRVMYAMDYPYQFVPEEVAVTDGLKIGAADLRKLYQTNAERVFKL